MCVCYFSPFAVTCFLNEFQISNETRSGQRPSREYASSTCHFLTGFGTKLVKKKKPRQTRPLSSWRSFSFVWFALLVCVGPLGCGVAVLAAATDARRTLVSENHGIQLTPLLRECSLFRPVSAHI